MVWGAEKVHAATTVIMLNTFNLNPSGRGEIYWILLTVNSRALNKMNHEVIR